MQNATTRNSNAKQIEARIRKGIILTSGKKVAEAIGIHKSQITRWQSENGMIEKISRLLDAIGYDSPVQDIVITGEEVKKLIRCWNISEYQKNKSHRQQSMRLMMNKQCMVRCSAMAKGEASGKRLHALKTCAE